MSDQKIQIKIQTKAEARSCQSGDFDIIKSLIKNGHGKDFLLSVEKLKGGSGHPFTRLSLLDIMKGDAFDFALPMQVKAQEYGVFLCLDPEKSNSCSRKSALATKDWNTAINKNKLPSNILYFQLITTQASKAYIIPIDRWGKEDMNLLGERLGDLLAEPQESLGITAQLMSKMGSLPGDVSSGSLALPLPYRDPRCDSKAAIPPNPVQGSGGSKL